MTKKSKKRVFIKRLGCPKLDVDIDYLEGGFVNREVQLTRDPDEADAVLISTCAFIEPAKIEAIDTILEAVRWKEEQKNRKVYVTGCMPERYPTELAKEIPEVDGWYGFGKWRNILEELAGADPQLEDTSVCQPSSRMAGKIPDAVERLLSRERVSSSDYHAFVKISEGCNRHCAYCAIPKIRGPYKSRPEKDILREIERLLDLGTKEIILIGQEVNSYGKDLSGRESIEKLLPEVGELIHKKLPDGWLRVLYTHPPLFNEAFITALRDTPNLVPYLDFPIEHADDTVLKAMGRRTTWKQMRHWIERLREEIPGIVLRTSVIVGHPGEGAKQFENLLERLNEAAIERVGIFRFSPEEDTPAAMMDPVDEGELDSREAEAQSLSYELSENWYQSCIGRDSIMLVESIDELGRLTGRSVWDAPEIDGDALLHGSVQPGHFVNGRIIDASPYTLEFSDGT